MSERPEVIPALYTRKQTAKRLNCSTQTVRRMERAGKLSAVRLGGETAPVLNPIAEVEAIAKGE